MLEISAVTGDPMGGELQHRINSVKVGNYAAIKMVSNSAGIEWSIMPQINVLIDRIGRPTYLTLTTTFPFARPVSI